MFEIRMVIRAKTLICLRSNFSFLSFHWKITQIVEPGEARQATLFPLQVVGCVCLQEASVCFTNLLCRRYEADAQSHTHTYNSLTVFLSEVISTMFLHPMRNVFYHVTQCYWRRWETSYSDSCFPSAFSQLYKSACQKPAQSIAAAEFSPKRYRVQSSSNYQAIPICFPIATVLHQVSRANWPGVMYKSMDECVCVHLGVIMPFPYCFLSFQSNRTLPLFCWLYVGMLVGSTPLSCSGPQLTPDHPLLIFLF